MLTRGKVKTVVRVRVEMITRASAKMLTRGKVEPVVRVRVEMITGPMLHGIYPPCICLCP